MARPLRVEYEGAFYHITARGNERRAIFLTDEDFSRFLKVLERTHERYGILVHAYVLMTNHYHLLMETPRGNLVATLHDLNTAYTNYFNRTHDRVGHLFQGRYRSILVEKDAYLLELSRYIHLNPIRAGLVRRPESYRWSSYLSYVSLRSSPGWLCTREVLGEMGQNKARARRKYRQFVEEGLNGKEGNPFERLIAGIALGGEGFWEEVKARVHKLERASEVPTLKEVHRKTDVKAIVEKVASFYEVSTETVSQKKRSLHVGSQVAMYLARKKTDLSLNEIGAFFGGRHYTAVSVAFRRVEQRLQRDTKFDQELAKIEKQITQQENF